MTKDVVLSEMYTSAEYDKCIYNILKEKKHMFDDAKQDVYEILMGKDEATLVDMYSRGKMKFYFLRVLMNQINSTSSRFFKMYRSNELKEASSDYAVLNLTEEEEVEVEEFDIYAYVLNSKVLSWAQMEMFNLYYRIYPSFMEEDITVHMSHSVIAKKLGVSKPNINQQINHIKYLIFCYMLEDNTIKNAINEVYILDYINNYKNLKTRKK